jgi:hypothetical protein
LPFKCDLQRYSAVFAAASDSEKLKNVYFTYKETAEGGEEGGGGGGALQGEST